MEIQHDMFWTIDTDLCSVPSLLFPDRYYISKGAIVDQLGGDLSSTPLHWAIRWLNDREGICWFALLLRILFSSGSVVYISIICQNKGYGSSVWGLGVKLGYNIHLFIFYFV